jgi:hypothetical protein
MTAYRNHRPIRHPNHRQVTTQQQWVHNCFHVPSAPSDPCLQLLACVRDSVRRDKIADQATQPGILEAATIRTVQVRDQLSMRCLRQRIAETGYRG